jgi:hypothetical protein
MPPSLGRRLLIALMMQAARTSEKFVNFHQTTRRNILEVSHLHTCRRDDLKTHQLMD